MYGDISCLSAEMKDRANIMFTSGFKAFHATCTKARGSSLSGLLVAA